MDVDNIFDDTNLDMISDTENDIGGLDMKWLDDLEHHNREYGKFYKDDVFNIKIVFIYTDANKNIEYVSSKHVDLENKNIFTQNELVNVIHNINHFNKKRYRLLKCYLYNLDIEPDELQNFIRSKYEQNAVSQDTPFFHTVDVARNIVIQPTISQFQKMNTIYLIMGERDVIDGKRHGNTSHTNEGKTRKIKRVRFHPDVKQTRKRTYTSVTSS